MNVAAAAKKVLRKNRRVSDGHQYTIPSPDTYPYQWLWDSCFHAIALSHFEPQAAIAELRSLVSKQFENGMIPHMIYWEPGALYDFAWGTQGTSSLTQPPMLAYAAWQVHQQLPKSLFLKELYPSLAALYRYLIDKRDPRDHHLVGIVNPDESGEDNSPRFDAVLQVPDDISFADHLVRRLTLVDEYRNCNFDAESCMYSHFWVKDVPFNAILVENLRVMGLIAIFLGEDDDVQFWSMHANLIAQAMRDTLLCNGVYFSVHGANHKQLPVATWAHFAPLFAGLYTQTEARQLIETHFYNEATFRAPFGLRTTAATEPSYRQDGFWRGPVWMAPHWFVYKGLMRYGFVKEAAWIRQKSTTLLERSGFREYFNPETAEGYGAHDFTWGALILDMTEA